MSIGRRVFKERKDRGLSQESLAKTIGVTPSYVSQIESELRTPSYALLIKIAAELGVSPNYLVGGEAETLDDDTSKVIGACLKYMDSKQKEGVLEYIYRQYGFVGRIKVPFHDTPAGYADYLVKRYELTLPVNPSQLAAALGIPVLVVQECEQEGILYKGGDQPVILVGQEPSDPRRRKFTVAMLLGHLLIPWHLRSRFVRERDRRSLSSDDVLQQQAFEFAGELIMPQRLLREDFKPIKGRISALEDLAYNRYDVSLTSMAHKYVEAYGSSCAYVTSHNGKVTRPYVAGLPFELKEEVEQGTLAATFLSDPPKVKETRTGQVEASAWVVQPPKRLKVFEDSTLDPANGYITTLLRFSGVKDTLPQAT